MIQFILLSMAAASALPCHFDLNPGPWDTLPSVGTLPLPKRFIGKLREHERFAEGRARFGRGVGLHFDSSSTPLNAVDGWGIQARFLQLVLAEWFPESTFGWEDGAARAVVEVSIVDSRMSGADEDHEVEMDYLKTANPGVELPGRRALRARLKLPPRARIASVYGSSSHWYDLPVYVSQLINDGLADVVIVSTQNGVTPVLGRPSFTSKQWTNLPGAPPARGVIINQTRGLMPIIHAAADYAVVIGLANGVEPIHQGRRTFVTRTALVDHMRPRWTRYVRDLTDVGHARTFDSPQELAGAIRFAKPETHQRVYLYDDPRIMDRLLAQILTMMDRVRVKE